MANYPVSGLPMPEIDLREITYGELSDLLDPRQTVKAANETISKASGLSVEDIRALRVHDYRALVRSIFIKSWQPPDDLKN